MSITLTGRVAGGLNPETGSGSVTLTGGSPGPAGPSIITTATATDLAGLLTGDGNTVGVATVGSGLDLTGGVLTASVPTVDAGDLTGTTLAATVVGSSLTSVGRLTAPLELAADLRMSGSSNLVFAPGRGIGFQVDPFGAWVGSRYFWFDGSMDKYRLSTVGIYQDLYSPDPALTSRLYNGGVSQDYVWLRADAYGSDPSSGILARGGSSADPGGYLEQAEVRCGWADGVTATRAGRLSLTAYSVTTAQEGVRVDADAGGVRLGFFGGSAAAKPTVTGSRSDGTALASLLTALAGLGLLTDSTTA